MRTRGIGTFLYDFSLGIAYGLSEKVECRFLVLNAKENAIGFCRQHRLKLLPGQKKRTDYVLEYFQQERD